LFIAHDAVANSNRISLTDPDSCPEYDRWQRLRSSRVIGDFRRICRFGSGLPSLSDCLFDFAGFSEESQLTEHDEIWTRMSQVCEDRLEIVVKSIGLSEGVDNCIIENLMNLRHPCIAGAIGVILPSRSQGVKIIRKYLRGRSLSEVISRSPEWWTPTAKAKAVAAARTSYW
jgi:hypothetical protein